jgi:hypothetical protein
MMKPINHHFSVTEPVPTGKFGFARKKWMCTLAYCDLHKTIGIAVVGGRDQFCRKTGGSIAYQRALNPELTVGRYAYVVTDDEELKEILVKFRNTKTEEDMVALILSYFPDYKFTRVSNRPSKAQAVAG